jgi:malate synthase
LNHFLESEVLPGLDLSEELFWTSLENIINEFSPKNKKLLEIRESMQGQIDAWHLANPGQEKNLDAYKNFLKEIGYLLEERWRF